MITREQAGGAADALIEQQKRLKRDARNANAPSLPFLYRIPELNALEPWQQNELLRAAQTNLRARPAYLAVFLLTLLAFAWPALELPPFDALPTLRPTYLIALFILPSLGAQAYFVRREIRRLLLDRIDTNTDGATP